jgi:methylase of polypeptide subunit release factors
VTEADKALVELLTRLKKVGYEFTTVTPESHRRVVARRSQGSDLRDALGWSLPVPRSALPPDLCALLLAADALTVERDLVRSRFRVSRVGDHLFVHSAYPTNRPDAVFLGPDTYRFVSFAKARLAEGGSVRHLVDMGAGSGAGAIGVAELVPDAEITLVDCNPLALRLARINAAAAGIKVGLSEKLPRTFDLYLANPPFIQDGGGRFYRNGGGQLGAETSLIWALEAARRVAVGGRILLYTGSAIVAGRDWLREQLESRLPGLGCRLCYDELDPDIFGEELDRPAYQGVERIAAIGAVIIRQS